MLSPSLAILLVLSGIAGMALLIVDSLSRKGRARATGDDQDLQKRSEGQSIGAWEGKQIGAGGAAIAFLAFVPVAVAKGWNVADLAIMSVFTLVTIVFAGGFVGVWATRRQAISAVGTSGAAAFLAGLYWISHEFRDRNPDGMEKAFRDMFVVVFAMPSSVGCGALLWWLVYTFRSAKR